LEAVSRPGHSRARGPQRTLPNAGVAANLENHAGTVSASDAAAERRPIKCGLAAECDFDARMNAIAWAVFVVAALLEVGGDAVIRHGLRGHKLAVVAAGFVTLGCYGLLVNSLKWDFSKLLGVYVGFFALTSVLAGRFIFRENVPWSTWCGLGLIATGCAVIQCSRP
jgi:small multidrug resistance family-3 protein